MTVFCNSNSTWDSVYICQYKCSQQQDENVNTCMYSGPSQQRPPSLMWPQIVAAPTINVFTSPSHPRLPL